MKIIIFGATGNLGIQLSKIFSGDDAYKVISWSKDDIDITDKELVDKKISEIKPDYILNCAAYNDVDKCETDDQAYAKAKRINAEAVGYLADAALNSQSTIIHISTDYVFDGAQKEGYKEDDEPKPLSRYAETKYLGEKEIIRRSGKGLKRYLIRTSKLFGPKGKDEKSKPSFFDLIWNLSQSRDSLSLVSGEEISCFTYTVDLATAIKNLIESEAGYGLYHLVNSGPVSWYEGAIELFKLRPNNKVKIIPVKTSAEYPRPAKRPKYSVLLNTKLPPLRNWREALREYLETGIK